MISNQGLFKHCSFERRMCQYHKETNKTKELHKIPTDSFCYTSTNFTLQDYLTLSIIQIVFIHHGNCNQAIEAAALLCIKDAIYSGMKYIKGIKYGMNAMSLNNDTKLLGTVSSKQIFS